ncbi:MAG: QueT transporter family protein [Eubacteriaceae bacterium]|nr:QueT transporter family protein [Eubacteriaceae bacterium]
MENKTKFLVKAGIIAALYAVLTLLIAPLSYGQMQIRISEALTILPFFTPAAIPGLFAGCLLANFFGSPLGMLDVILGSLTTLVAAWMASKIKNKYLVPLPAILLNAMVIPYVLYVFLGFPYLVSVLWVGLGEIAAVYGLGLPLLLFIEKNKAVKDMIKD